MMRRGILLLLLLMAAVRVAYLIEYSTSLPFIDAPLFDSPVYLAQAQALREGRFADPTLLAFSPLYGYFLALLGGGLYLPVYLQLLLGCANAYLLYRLCARREEPGAALLSAALYGGYGLLLHFESKILSETLGVTLLLLALDRYLQPGFQAARLRSAAACGALLALAVLARASLLFSAPLFVAAALLPWQRGGPARRARLRCSVGLALGLGAVLLVSGLWNYAHSGFFVPVIFVSQTVQRATSAQWKGTLQDLTPEGASGPGPWDVVEQAQRRLAGQAPPAPPGFGIDWWGFLRGAPKKLRLTLLDTEISSFMYSYYGEQKELRIYALQPVSFGMLLLLGALGALFLARREGPRALWPFLPLVLGTLITCTLYHPSSRYRLPLMFPGLVLGGMALQSLWRLPRPRPGLPALVLVGLALLAMELRTLTYQLKRPAMWHVIVAHGLFVRGEVAEAERRVQEARRISPGDAEVERYLRSIRR